MDKYKVHEALHMASFLCGAVSDELCDKDVIMENAEWHALAQKAFQALDDLYAAIGNAHLTDGDE